MQAWATAGSQCSLIAAAAVPCSISIPPFDASAWSGSCAMLIQFKANHDVGDQHIKDFVAQPKPDMRTNKPCAAIWTCASTMAATIKTPLPLPRICRI